MQQVTLKQLYLSDQPIGNFIMLETVEDVNEYYELNGDQLSSAFSQLARNPDMDFKDSLDHSIQNAIPFSQLSGESPIIQAAKMIGKKHANMLFAVAEGRKILIRENGSYCYFCKKSFEFVGKNTINSLKEKIYEVSDSPSLLNLENDPTLENHTIEYFKNNDLNLSYICNLRYFSKAELIDTFKDFASKGGYGLYVYTTASDVAQMEEYSEAAIEAGLSEVVFEFNAGMCDEHILVIDKLEENGVKVSYKETLKV